MDDETRTGFSNRQSVVSPPPDPVDSFRVEQIAIKALQNFAALTEAEAKIMAAAIVAHLGVDHDDPPNPIM